LRTISCFVVFVMLSPVGLVAQSAPAAAPVPAQAAVDDPGAPTPLGYAGGTAPANLRPFRRDSRAIFDDNVFSINQQRVGDEASSLGPNIALPEPSEYQEISLNYSPSLLLCPPTNQLSILNQGLGLGSSCRSGAGYMLGLHDSHSYLLGGVPPIPGRQTVSGHRLATNLDSKDRTSPAMTRVDTPSLDALHSRSEEHGAMAFQEAAPQSGSGRHALRDKVALIILSSAAHAAVTWDAQSTNHFFHHYPNGFRPIEADPLMSPFAGKALMYPMMNLFFAVPVDLLLLKTRHSQKPIRILTYAAASGWAGLEIHQSIANIRNEHLTLAPAIEPAKAIARMK